MGALETQAQRTALEGVLLQPLSVIPTQGGPVLHFLRSDYALMPTFPQGFGEVYFSVVDAGAIKAWKRHTRQTQLFAVPMGLLKIVLYDARPASATKGQVAEFLLGRPEHYMLLKIPAGIWYGFGAQNGALLCNCSDIAHDPNESERLPMDTALIPYTWASLTCRDF